MNDAPPAAVRSLAVRVPETAVEKTHAEAAGDLTSAETGTTAQGENARAPTR